MQYSSGDFNRAWKADPYVKAARDKMAADFRRMRRDHPEMAKLVWRRFRGAIEGLNIKEMWDFPRDHSTVGLSALLKRDE